MSKFGDRLLWKISAYKKCVSFRLRFKGHTASGYVLIETEFEATFKDNFENDTINNEPYPEFRYMEDYISSNTELQKLINDKAVELYKRWTKIKLQKKANGVCESEQIIGVEWEVKNS